MIDIASTFRKFCEEIHLESRDFEVSLAEIAKKLNRHYYANDSETDHLFIVGSIGRETAVEGVSDVDVIFELPEEVYRRFDVYESNGQSALLQEVKSIISERYPRTDMKGDGQVVDVFFDAYTIELVPAFRQDDDSFVHADSNDGGSWKTTNPFPEQRACKEQDGKTGGTFVHAANMLRAWKNNKGFAFGGLLVDTLAYGFFDQNPEWQNVSFDRYYELCLALFGHLAKQNPDQAYWFAPGSNQHVANCDEGAFVSRAKKAATKLENAGDDGKEDALTYIFGRKFAVSVVQDNIKESNFSGYSNRSAPQEEFIEDKFPVDITNRVKLDCEVTQNGFRKFFLSGILSRKQNKWLSKNKQLRFYVVATDVPEPFDVYWKVRNIGDEAQRRGMERGQILEDIGYRERKEHTDFNGVHYVECYIVKNKVCVARTRIQVPINVGYVDREHLILNE